MLSKAQTNYLSHFVDGPGFPLPVGVSANTMQAAVRNGLAERTDNGMIQLTDKGRAALSN